MGLSILAGGVRLKSVLKRDRDFSQQVTLLDKSLKLSFAAVKEEFDEHLLAINESTTELQVHDAKLEEIDNKIEKVASRLDELSMMIKQFAMQSRYNIDLGYFEQKVFMALYMFENGFLSLEDISKKSSVPLFQIREIITSMLDKGVRMTRDVVEGKVLFKLEDSFRQKQAVEQVVKISSHISLQLENKPLEMFF